MKILKISTLFALALIISGCEKTNYGPIVEETYVHRYGVEVPAQDWAVKGQSGKVITTLKNGVVCTKNVSSGILEGETSYTFPYSETVQKVESYQNGNLEKMMVYYRSGKPAQEVIFNGQTRHVTKWYENGAPQSKEEIENDKLVTAHYYSPKNHLEAQVIFGNGNRIQRDVYGQSLSVDTIQDGEMVLCATTHSNGAPKDLIPYKNRVIEGELRTYLPAGEPNTIEMWYDGQKEGITVTFLNGEKYAEIPYVSGLKHGIEKRFKDGRQIIEELTWNNDKRHGPSYSYIGDNKRTDWYFQDRLVTEKTFDLLDHGRTPKA